MPEIKLVAETRTQFGKGAARKIRRDHKIPAVMYGHGTEPVHITLPGHDTMMALKQRQRPAHHRARRRRAARARQGRPARPDQAGHRARRPRHRERVARRSPSTSPCTTEGEAAPETVVTVDSPDHPARGARDQHPRERRRLRRGPRGRHPGPGRPARAARGRRRSSPTPRRSSSTSPQQISAEALEAELAEAEAEAGIEHEEPTTPRRRPRARRCRGRGPPTRPEPPADAEAPSPSSAARRDGPGPSTAPAPLRHTGPVTTRPGSSSGWATPARRTPATATTSGRWSVRRARLAATTLGALAARRLGPRRRRRAKAIAARALVDEVRLAARAGPRWCSPSRRRYMNESGGPVAGAAALLLGRPRAADRGARRARHRRPVTSGSSAAVARAATTACARSAARSAPRTTCGCGSASAAPRAGWTRPTSCCATSRRASAPELPFVLDEAADAVEALVTEGLVAAQQRFHCTGLRASARRHIDTGSSSADPLCGRTPGATVELTLGGCARQRVWGAGT